MSETQAKRPKAQVEWSPDSWRQFPIKQQPEYLDQGALKDAVGTLRRLPPLVQASEVDSLRGMLAEVHERKRFILQGGDCAEQFEACSSTAIENKLKIIMQMSLVLVYSGKMPVVRIARMAGQYMKPRSAPKETVEGREVYSYKGDSINSFDLDDRVPRPGRLVEAYFHSAATLNYTRGLLASDFSDVRHPRTWDLGFMTGQKKPEYDELLTDIGKAVDFLGSCGLEDSHVMRHAGVYMSHEGLLLEYEQALTRESANGSFYDLSAHFVWIGDRTRQLDGAHVEFMRGIENPVGIKVGPTTKPEELVELIKTIDPSNKPGRVVLITRFGCDNVQTMLPPVLEAVSAAGLNVVYECDPMHGNTYQTEKGIKSRSFEKIIGELLNTFDVHEQHSSWLGGVHFEMTGDDVTECTGGVVDIQDHDLVLNYQSVCDPRLNYAQSLEIAFLVAKRLLKRC